MIVTTAIIYVKEEHIEDFIKASIADHTGSVKEPGNLRFDVLQCIDDPTRFTLYEAYETEEAVKAHKTTAHYLKWRETVESYMAKPRQSFQNRVIAPSDIKEWK